MLVRVPDWWAGRPRPQVSVTIGSSAVATLDANAILDFKIGVALGVESLDAEELEQLRAIGSGLALLKGRWVEVDAALLEEALAHWNLVKKEVESNGLSFAEGMRLLAGAPISLASPSPDDEELRDWSLVRSGPWLSEVLDKLHSPESIEAKLPRGVLKAELRAYQEAGLRWLHYLSSLGLGACLADDMGLGKTIQVIALLLVIKDKRALPPCSSFPPPSSRIGNPSSSDSLPRCAPASSTPRWIESRIPTGERRNRPSRLHGFMTAIWS